MGALFVAFGHYELAYFNGFALQQLCIIFIYVQNCFACMGSERECVNESSLTYSVYKS